MNGNSYEFEFRTYERWRPSVFQSLTQWVADLMERRRVRREIRYLHDMSDHMLRDIGLARADLSDDRSFSAAAELRSRNQS